MCLCYQSRNIWKCGDKNYSTVCFFFGKAEEFMLLSGVIILTGIKREKMNKKEKIAAELVEIAFNYNSDVSFEENMERMQVLTKELFRKYGEERLNGNLFIATEWKLMPWNAKLAAWLLNKDAKPKHSIAIACNEKFMKNLKW